MKRRTFLQILTAALGLSALGRGTFGLAAGRGREEPQRRVLPADTDLGSLLFENPADLDARNLPITPLQEFETMGLSDHKVDRSRWRLSIGGAVAKPQSLDYRQVCALPAVERNVLLICPGVFAYHARWQGLSIETLLQQADAERRVTHVDVRGPAGPYEKVMRFPLADVRNGRVLLAYAVNGRPLPQKHGHPLRAVAEGYVGSEWIKYVDTVEALVIESSPARREPQAGTAPAFLP